MASPIQFYRSFQRLMRDHGIRHVLTSGMACVEYGIQQNTKDTDWIVHPDDLEKLVAMLCESERGLTGRNWLVTHRPMFGAPFLKEYHQGGWTTHIAIRDEPLSAEHHLDFFGKAPRLKGEEWLPSSGGIASRTIVAQMKKTDRPKDWPFVNGLAVQACESGDAAGLLHARDPSVLRLHWQTLDECLRAEFLKTRPLLGHLDQGDDRLERLLMIERGIWECVNRERYLVYQHEWKEFYRRWQKDAVGQWPTVEPFELQHRRLVDAAIRFDLAPAPLSDTSRREGIYQKGLNRAFALTAATPAEASMVAMPIQVILP